MKISHLAKYLAVAFLLTPLLLLLIGCVRPPTATKKTNATATSDATPADPLPARVPENDNRDKPDTPTADEISGRVIGISDGDTITVLDDKKTQYKIRLQGIDAPESGQDFGQVSKQNLSHLIYGKTVHTLLHKKDKYGRFVGTIYLEGKDINLEQVKAGLAWHYKQYENEQSGAERTAYSNAETSAKNSKAGLWKQPNPVPPWDWRHNGNSVGLTTETLLQGTIIGNRNSKIYHWPGCESYNKVAERNRVLFNTAEEAVAAGYRAARNCHSSPPRG
jgi:endonuclease YncB( thermonuclease family)